MGFLCVLRGVWESGKTESRLCPVAKIVNAFLGLFLVNLGASDVWLHYGFWRFGWIRGGFFSVLKALFKNTNEMCCVTSVNIWNFVCQR